MLITNSEILDFARNYIKNEYFFDLNEELRQEQDFFVNEQSENLTEYLASDYKRVTNCEVIQAKITHKFKHSVKVAVKARVNRLNLDNQESNVEKVFLGITFNEEGGFDITSSVWCAPFLSAQATSEYELNQTPTWYLLVDTAYDRWQDDDLKYASYEEFIDALAPKQRQAVLLMSLSAQVSNGGFQQWLENGYAAKIDEVISILKLINQPKSAEVAKLLVQLRRYVRTNISKRGFFNGYWNKGCERFWCFIGRMNFNFYKLIPGFEAEVEAFLCQEQ